MEIKITQTKAVDLKKKPEDEANLNFGDIFTDYMFLMDFEEGKGWLDPRIVPYGNFSIDPAAMCIHYGQEIFEGLKAYRGRDGGIYLFRPEGNINRFNRSATYPHQKNHNLQLRYIYQQPSAPLRQLELLLLLLLNCQYRMQLHGGHSLTHR